MCAAEEEVHSGGGHRKERGGGGCRSRQPPKRSRKNGVVQHVRDVERGELQAGALRLLFGGLAAAPHESARAPDPAHVLGQHKR